MTDAATAPVRRASRFWRRAALGTAIAGVILIATVAWLLRDPLPYMMQRRSSLEGSVLEVLQRDSAHVNERVLLQAASGLEVSIIIRRPRNIAEPVAAATMRRPVFLILGGHRTGDHAATLIPDTDGNIIAAMAYPFEGDVGIKGLAVVGAVPLIRRAIMDTPPAIMIALDYLLSRPDVDSTRVELVGASFGAPFACLAGALDERVTRVWSVYGAARLYDQVELNMRRNISFAPARHLVTAVANVLGAGPRLAPEYWAPQIAPRPFIMVNASEDERMPREGVLALYEAAGDPKELIWLEGQHLHRSRPDVLARLVETVLQRAN
jgi:hypothetical protein